MKRILSLLFSITLSFTFFPIDAFAAPIDETRSVDGATSLFAQTSNIASGMWGTCPWELSTDGTLTVHPGKAATGGSSPWNIDQHKTKIKKIIFASEGEAKVEAPMNCSGLFAPYGAVPTTFEFIDFSGFDTSKTTNMGSMFWDCSSLVTLDFSSFDTSRVRDMNYMFNGCASLVSVDVSSFDTSNVEGMQDMFHGCASLEGLDLSSFNTSRVGSIWNMFRDCASLAYLDISSFDTSKYWGGDIFTGCYELAHVVVGERPLQIFRFMTRKSTIAPIGILRPMGLGIRSSKLTQAEGALLTSIPSLSK